MVHLRVNFTLTRQSVETVAAANRFVWPLHVTVSSADGDPAVFVYHRRSRVSAEEDIFECVASVNQMTELPVTEPDMEPDEDGNVTPYYRLATLAFNCRSLVEADDLWLRIQEDIQDLADNLRAWASLQVEEVVSINSDTEGLDMSDGTPTLRITRGQDFAQAVTLQQTLGVPLDLTDLTVTADLMNGEVVAQAMTVVILSAADGTLRLELTEAEIAAQTDSTLAWRLRIEDTMGDIRTVMSGAAYLVDP